MTQPDTTASGLVPKRRKVLVPTPLNIEGPFYRPGAPLRKKLFDNGDRGEVLFVRGKLIDTDGRPLAGGVLDLWQATFEGHYDNEDPDRPPPVDKFRLRGRVQADEGGNYEFQTLRPGAYKLTPLQYRPPHIHVKVLAEGYRTLTTQFFFREEEHNRLDPWYKPELVLDLQPEGKVLAASFNIVLPKP